jgi:hypothetical protein
LAIALLTAALLALRAVLRANGHDVPPAVFVVTFFVIVGGAYGLAAKLVLQEVNRLKAGAEPLEGKS